MKHETKKMITKFCVASVLLSAAVGQYSMGRFDNLIEAAAEKWNANYSRIIERGAVAVKDYKEFGCMVLGARVNIEQANANLASRKAQLEEIMNEIDGKRSLAAKGTKYPAPSI